MRGSSRREPKLICFTGMDGVGKTTLAKYLVETMRENSIQYKYVYGRLKPLILKPFIMIGRKTLLRGKDMFENYKGYSIKKRDIIKQHPLLFTLYKYLLLFDYSLQLLFKVKLPYLFGKKLVCDRYVYDTVITDLSVDMNLSTSEIRGLIKRLFYIAPKPDLVFLIDLPEVIAFQRKDDIPSIEYLKKIRNIYLSIGREEKMIILDGSKDLTKLKDMIQKQLKQHDELGGDIE